MGLHPLGWPGSSKYSQGACQGPIYWDDKSNFTERVSLSFWYTASSALWDNCKPFSIQQAIAIDSRVNTVQDGLEIWTRQMKTDKCKLGDTVMKSKTWTRKQRKVLWTFPFRAAWDRAGAFTPEPQCNPLRPACLFTGWICVCQYVT